MDVQELKLKSKENLAKYHNGPVIAGGALLTGFAFVAGGPIALAGAFVAAAAMYLESDKEFSDKCDKVDDPNCLDHLNALPRKEIAALKRQHGKDVVNAALKGDKDALGTIFNIDMSTVNVTHTQVNAQINTTINNYNAHVATPTPVQQPEPVAVVDVNPIPVQPVVHPASTPTQLQQATVLQEPELIKSQPTQFISELPSQTQASIDLYNPAEDLGKDPYSALIVGVPGSGKGIFLANAVRSLRQNNTGLMIVGIDPKANEEEFAIWDNAFDIVYRRQTLNDSPDDVARWLIDIINKVKSIQGPTLLVVDELTAISSKLQFVMDKELKLAASTFQDYLCSLASLGNSSQKYIWGIAQAAQVQSLPFGSAVRNQLRTIALISDENIGNAQGLIRTDLIPTPAKDMGLINEALNASPVRPNKVAVYDGKYAQWFPMPELKIYGKPRKEARIEAAKQAINQAKSQNFSLLSNPVQLEINPTITSHDETIAAEAKDTTELIQNQFAANIDRIHAGSAKEDARPKTKLSTLEMINKAQELLASCAAYNQKERDAVLGLVVKDPDKALRYLLWFMDYSKAKLATHIGGLTSPSGASYQQYARYYDWLEQQYGSIREEAA